MKRSITLIVLVISALIVAQTQEIHSIRSYTLVSRSDTNYHFADTAFSSQHLIRPAINFHLSDTTDLSELLVSLFNEQDSSLILSDTLFLAHDTVYDNGRVVIRQGTSVRLRLEEVQGFDAYYGSLQLLYSDGSYSSTYSFSKN